MSSEAEDSGTTEGGSQDEQQQEMSRYMAEQRSEINGPVNRYFAGLELGHDPTSSEAAMHYITHGGADDFARRHPRRIAGN